MRKIILVIFLVNLISLSAATVNTYYVVTSDTAYGWRLPYTMTTMSINSVESNYRHNDVLYITRISQDDEYYGEYGYVKKDKAWVPLLCIRALSEKEIAQYKEDVKRSKGSKPLRILLWIFLGLVILGTGAMFFTDDPLHSLGAYFATILLCIAAVLLSSYMQFIICWGLKIVGWIQHYILFGWFTDMFVNGILSIIPFIFNLPSFGLYGLIAGLLPAAMFYGIAYLFRDYPFTQWVVYVFQLATLLAVLVLVNDGWYSIFNPFMHLDGIDSLSSLARACDWGQYANNVFIMAYYVGTIILLIPHSVLIKYLEK